MNKAELVSAMAEKTALSKKDAGMVEGGSLKLANNMKKEFIKKEYHLEARTQQFIEKVK